MDSRSRLDELIRIGRHIFSHQCLGLFEKGHERRSKEEEGGKVESYIGLWTSSLTTNGWGYRQEVKELLSLNLDKPRSLHESSSFGKKINPHPSDLRPITRYSSSQHVIQTLRKNFPSSVERRGRRKDTGSNTYVTDLELVGRVCYSVIRFMSSVVDPSSNPDTTEISRRDSWDLTHGSLKRLPSLLIW